MNIYSFFYVLEEVYQIHINTYKSKKAHYLFIYWWGVFTCMMPVWRSENSFRKLVFLPHVGPSNGTQVLGLGGKRFLPWSHLPSPCSMALVPRSSLFPCLYVLSRYTSQSLAYFELSFAYGVIHLLSYRDIQTFSTVTVLPLAGRGTAP